MFRMILQFLLFMGGSIAIVTAPVLISQAVAADQASYDRYAEAARAEHKYVVKTHCEPLKPAEAIACREQANRQLAEALKMIRAKFGGGK